MRCLRCALFCGLIILSVAAWSQNVKISIPAGTPEDKDLATISAESDAGKRLTMYQDFAKKYADNKPAYAYAEWQISQQLLTDGKSDEALAAGDKALALFPNNLDIIVSQASVAQAMKDNTKVVDYAARGADVYHSIAAQKKPADLADADWTSRITDEQNGARPGFEFLETAAYNAISAEQDASKRMSEIEKFTPAFPNSQFEQQISQLALYSLQQLNQPERVESYGEKALAANPDSIPTLLMLANAYSEDPKQSTKAASYASKVITLCGNPSTADKNHKLSAGVAHSTLGYVYLKQDKTAVAVTELKTAVSLLDEDPDAQQAALFRLGYAYAKVNRKADAIATLKKAQAMNGPYQKPATDLLAKISAAGKK